ncbi:hypothetical protein N7462_000313 [Penicillium macrosclerotiorum]|uniref:uncharacterized protein n=1 Tax=Penicillium macrosclerotiorum TaxID=303699 RepID=UPI002548030F|nr:uncharacterized protein N7462_000313 [Penicillium macrosclerotiorum]KAJ5698308.1 hypothetical protein N7462_000313 [Penicillium macrosclerotiorum]
MGKRKELTPSTRSRICSLRNDAKMSFNEIAKHFPSIPRSTIISTCKREAIRGRENKTLERSGRPPILSEAERNRIRDHLQQHPGALYRDLLEVVDYKCSRETLRRILKDMGLHKDFKKRVLPKKPNAVCSRVWVLEYHCCCLRRSCSVLKWTGRA